MRAEDHLAAIGVVLTQRRARVWVAGGTVYWQRGRTTTIVPGGQVRRVTASGQLLELHLFDEEAPLTISHRMPEVVSALAAEIETLIVDIPGARPAVRTDTPSGRPVRAARAARSAGERLARLTVRQRCWLAYVFVVAPVIIATSWSWGTGVGFETVLTAAVGYGLLTRAVKVAKPRTRWILARRGVTVRTKIRSGKKSVALITYRDLDGLRHTLAGANPGYRSEARFDPRDPSRALPRTRVAWAFELLGGLLLGALGLLALVPLLGWIVIVAQEVVN